MAEFLTDFNTPPDINDYVGTTGQNGVPPVLEFAQADKSGEDRDQRADSLIALVNFPGLPYHDLKPEYDAFMASGNRSVQDLLDWFNDRLEMA